MSVSAEMSLARQASLSSATTTRQRQADQRQPREIKRYKQYKIRIDKRQDDKARQIKLGSFARPHMRAFHCSWWSFFVAFFMWFAIAPLLSEIQDTLLLTKHEVWNSTVVGVAGTAFMRLALGPLCDKYGARVLFALVLCFASIPVGLVGLVDSAAGLSVVRLFIGVAGGAFVMCQYWSSRMFTKEVAGTANALAGGWGNLGGGVTQLVMGSALFPLFKAMYDHGDRTDRQVSELAWRTVCIVPAFVGFATGVVVYFISDDAPKGDYAEMKRNGTMSPVSAPASFRDALLNSNTWLLAIQYGCCFGVELTMNNAAALYFKEEFNQTTESAAAIASIFGWMNLFARGLGGACSDKLNIRWGMRGRLLAQVVLLILEGLAVLVFANTKSLGGAIVVMVVFSTFVQAAEGSTYGIVPYVEPDAMGSVMGMVGAGGSAGGVGFAFVFRQLEYDDAFVVMAGTILASSLLTVFIYIKGHPPLFSWRGGGDDIPTSTSGRSSVSDSSEERSSMRRKSTDGDEESPQDSSVAVNSEIS